jgi:hypothetical protein
MAEAKSREAWDRTASLMALLANCHRNHRRKPTPFTPDRFHPYRQRAKRPTITLGDLAHQIGLLADAHKARRG